MRPSSHLALRTAGPAVCGGFETVSVGCSSHGTGTRMPSGPAQEKDAPRVGGPCPCGGPPRRRLWEEKAGRPPPPGFQSPCVLGSVSQRPDSFLGRPRSCESSMNILASFRVWDTRPRVGDGRGFFSWRSRAAPTPAGRAGLRHVLTRCGGAGPRGAGGGGRRSVCGVGSRTPGTEEPSGAPPSGGGRQAPGRAARKG